MIYLWFDPLSGYPQKLVGRYDGIHSPSARYSLLHGKRLTEEEFGICNLYVRYHASELPDDPFTIKVLRHGDQHAYIFTPQEMFFF